MYLVGTSLQQDCRSCKIVLKFIITFLQDWDRIFVPVHRTQVQEICADNIIWKLGSRQFPYFLLNLSNVQKYYKFAGPASCGVKPVQNLAPLVYRWTRRHFRWQQWTHLQFDAADTTIVDDLMIVDFVSFVFHQKWVATMVDMLTARIFKCWEDELEK